MKELELRNSYYYDANNNSWNAEWDTLGSATMKSKSLIDCSYCSDCRSCSSCSDCRDCSSCSDCSDCRDCSYFKSNPMRYVSKNMGSRNSQTSIYWIDTNIQIICGCFRGDINKFEEAIKQTHANNDTYKNEYLKLVELMKYITVQ